MRKYLITCALVLLVGCSSSGSFYQDMSEAIFGKYSRDDLFEMAEANPYTSVIISVDGNPPAFVPLAYAETATSIGREPNDQSLVLKWVTPEKYLLATQSGRFVKSVHFPGTNLVSVSSDQSDPLSLGLHHSDTPKVWRWTLSWQPNHHESYSAQSTFERTGTEVLSLFQGNVETLVFTEQVHIETVDVRYENTYWVHPEFGYVLQTQQRLTPMGPEFRVELAKPYQGGL
jgi:hypothetical protein